MRFFNEGVSPRKISRRDMLKEGAAAAGVLAGGAIARDAFHNEMRSEKERDAELIAGTALVLGGGFMAVAAGNEHEANVRFYHRIEAISRHRGNVERKK